MNMPNTNLCSLLKLYKASNYHKSKVVDEKHRTLYDYINSNVLSRRHISEVHNFLKMCDTKGCLIINDFKDGNFVMFYGFILTNTKEPLKEFEVKNTSMIEFIANPKKEHDGVVEIKDFYLPKKEVEHYLDKIMVIP